MGRRNCPAQRELYDLQSDPGELKNLAADPARAAGVAELHAALLRELRESPDDTEHRCRADGARAKAGGRKKQKQRGAKGKKGGGEAEEG